MTTNISATDICNMALDMLHEGPIADITEDSANARRFKRRFDQARDFFLVSHSWNFAVRRASLPASATAPAFGWKYQFLLPGECLRLLPLRTDGEFEGDLIPHEVESGYVLTDAIAPLKVMYLWRNEQYGTWSPAAIEAFAGHLAAIVAHAVTGKASYADSAKREAQMLLASARRLDGMSGTAQKPSYQDVISVRA